MTDVGSKPFQKYAAHRGRDRYDEVYGDKSYRTIFHHDRAEVTYSRFFRRTAFREYHIANPGFDNRTRLLHSIEVATIASGMARRLGLDPDLAEAIAMGHDIAQPPCGYPADNILQAWLCKQGGFDHGVEGANLLRWHSRKPKSDRRFERLSIKPCYKTISCDEGEMVTTISAEVLDGIAKHTPPKDDPYGNPPLTLEGQLVRIADNLSYLSQEIEEGLGLDASHRDHLLSFAAETVLRNTRADTQKTHKELLAKQPGCPCDPAFLEAMFDVRPGPRLVAMIKRIETYNIEKVKMDDVQWVKTEMCNEGRIPILKYDPLLKFIIDFLWDEFIIKVVNKFPSVVKRVANNRKKIDLALQIRMVESPTDLHELQEFNDRKAEVKYYYPSLRDKAYLRRVVAHHVALLTTQQINSLVRGKA
jgi:putative nucleotidyltransferase with HDIG domain